MPIMFQVYVNDIRHGVTCYMNLFADDAKSLKVVKTRDDRLKLQKDTYRIYEWSNVWALEFNAK